MRILFASSEIYPYAKSGGLADLSAAFLEAFSDQSLELFAAMPLYGFVSQKGLKKQRSFSLEFSGTKHLVEIFTTRVKKKIFYFIKAPYLSDTQRMYGDQEGDYANNDLRFALWSASLAHLAIEENIDILHLNDWHCALAPFYLRQKQSTIKTVLTIHNLAYQGVFAKESLHAIGIEEAKYFTTEFLEFYGKVNFLKAGIALSDVVTTVSNTYAQEIQTPAFGAGLDGFLRYHRHKLRGIINGIDTKEFDPSKDKALTFCYSAQDLPMKYLHKKELMHQYGLKDPRKPLFVMVSRLVEQKGLDLVLELLPELLEKKLHLLIVGEGEVYYEQKLQALSEHYANFVFIKGYDEKISRQVYGAGDFLLMPSRFEPCGLSQFIAMRYGTLPIVHNVGGLGESVHEKQGSGCGRGFVFDTFEKGAFMSAIIRALELRKNKKEFALLQKEGMECDFSLAKSVLQYLEIYKSLV